MDRFIDCPSFEGFGRDRFVENRLPPRADWPDLDVAKAGLTFPAAMNAADILLNGDGAGGAPDPDKPAIIGECGVWSYARLLATTDAVAHVLTVEFGLRPGGRVLLRGPNSPWLAACWLATVKAGGVVVATMPLLRGAELAPMLEKTRPSVALCDARYLDDLNAAMRLVGDDLPTCCFDGGGDAWAADASVSGRWLETMARAHLHRPFAAVSCAPDDAALICFTSGATGSPKAAVHFHRDLIAVADLSPRSILKTTADDIFCGSPGLAFAYGLGGLLLFPLRAGGTSVLLERATPEKLLGAIVKHQATILFAVPTAYRALINLARNAGLSRSVFASLRLCIAAGEPLTQSVVDGWAAVSGKTILDSLGTTEMLNAVLHAQPGELRVNAVGRATPGYEARVVDADMNDMPLGEMGRLAVRGPTGCRYLDDERQAAYVRDGWNLTGDAGFMDDAGYFHHQGRTDDLIVSGGYKFSGLEVEDVLLRHDAVAECAVVAGPDRLRGAAPFAFVVLRDGVNPTPELAVALQEHVRADLAAFKYPRIVAFIDEMPRTETGKIKRYRLREEAMLVAAQETAPVEA